MICKVFLHLLRPWYCIIQFSNLWQVVNSQIFDLQFVEFKAFLCCDQILHFIFYYYVFLYYLFGGGGPGEIELLCVWDFVFLKISQEENDKKKKKKSELHLWIWVCFSKSHPCILILLTCNGKFELCQWPKEDTREILKLHAFLFIFILRNSANEEDGPTWDRGRCGKI